MAPWGCFTQLSYTEGQHKRFNTVPPGENPLGQDSPTDGLLLRFILRSAKVTQPKRRHCCVRQPVSALRCKSGVSPHGRKAEALPSGFPRASRHKACRREPADVEWNPSFVAGGERSPVLFLCWRHISRKVILVLAFLPLKEWHYVKTQGPFVTRRVLVGDEMKHAPALLRWEEKNS